MPEDSCSFFTRITALRRGREHSTEGYQAEYAKAAKSNRLWPVLGIFEFLQPNEASQSFHESNATSINIINFSLQHQALPSN